MATITGNIRWADNTAELAANIKQGADMLDVMKSSVDKTVQAMSGEGLMAAAMKTAAAIDQLGGVTKLTAAEQDKANALIDKALEKYEAMGVTAPAALKDMSDALKDASDATEHWYSGFDGLGDALGKLFTDPIEGIKELASVLGSGITSSLESLGGAAAAAAAPIAAIAGAAVGVGATIFALAEHAAEAGEQVEAFSIKTGTAVENVGPLKLAADAAGGSLEQLASIARQIDMKGAKDTTGAFSNALADMNINAEQFKHEDFQTQLAQLAVGFEVAGEKGHVLADAQAIGGRAMAENIPFLEKMNPDLLAVAKSMSMVWTPELIQQSKTFTTDVGLFEGALGQVATRIGAELLPVMTSLLDTFVKSPTFIQGVISATDSLGHALGYLVIGMGGVAQIFISTWDLIKAGVYAVETAVVGSVDAIVTAALKVETLGAKLHIIDPADLTSLQNAKTYLDGMANSLAAETVAAGKSAFELSGFAQTTDKIGESLLAMGQKADTATTGVNKLNEIISTAKPKADDITKAYLALEKQLEAFELRFGAVNAGWVEGEDGSLQMAVNLGLFSKAIEESGKQIYDLVTKADEMGQAVPDSLRAIADGWAASQIDQLMEKTTLQWDKADQKFVDDEVNRHAKMNIDLVKDMANAAVQTSTLQKQAADLTAQLTDTTTNYQISKIWEWEGQQEIAFRGSEAQWGAFYDNLQQVTQLKVQALIDKTDPLRQAWKSMTQDMSDNFQNNLAKAFDATTTSLSSWASAALEPFTSFAAGVKKIFAGLLADLEAQFLSPLFGLLQQGLSVVVSDVYGSLGMGGGAGVAGSALGGGGGGGSSYTSIGEGLALKYGINYGKSALFGAGSVAGGTVGPIAGTTAGEIVGGGVGIGETTSVYGLSPAVSSGIGSSFAEGGGEAAAGTTASGGLSGAASYLPVAGAALGGYETWKLASEGNKTGATLAGAETGASIGIYGGPVGLAVGAGVGALVGYLASLMGVTPEEKSADAGRNQFLSSVAGVAPGQLDATATNKAIDTIGQTLARLGQTGDQTQVQLKALFDAKTPEAYNAALKPIADGLQQIAAVDAAFAGFKTAATNFSGVLTPAMQDTIAKLLTMQGLTSDETTALQTLGATGTPSLQTLEQTAQKYGMTLDNLGTKNQQLDISTNADQVVKDFQTLTQNGAEYGDTVNHFATQISGLVDEAIKYGGSLPTALQPIAQALINAGELTDATGKQIKDLSGIKFDDTGDPLANSMTALQTSLDNLTKALLGLPANAATAASGIGNALSGIQAPTITVKTQVDTSGIAAFMAGDQYQAGPGVPTYGIGGYVDHPTFALVGESGPEWIIPANQTSTFPSLSPSMVTGAGAVQTATPSTATAPASSGDTYNIIAPVLAGSNLDQAADSIFALLPASARRNASGLRTAIRNAIGQSNTTFTS